MSGDVLQKILKHIDIQCSRHDLVGLNIDFFGGEPFLNYTDCVSPILKHSRSVCERMNKRLYVSFTTNASLLSESIIKELSSYNIYQPVAMQITLDGNQAFHDTTRVSSDVRQTYTRIIENVRICVKYGLKVTLRFNYTPRNIQSFYDVIEDIEDLASMGVNVIFRKVWQARETKELPMQVEKLRDAYKKLGFNIENRVTLSHERCYADKNNTAVINYDGNIFKCTARSFAPSDSEGVLNNDGTITWNSKYNLRQKVKYGNSTCYACSILPLCHGRCSQFVMEHEGTSSCYCNYTKEEIAHLIKQRVAQILKQSK